MEARKKFKVSDEMLDFTFRLFELNRRLELTGEVRKMSLSDIELEGLFVLRDEVKKFESFEIWEMNKRNKHG